MTAAATEVDRAHCLDAIAKLGSLKAYQMTKADESAMLQAFNSLVPRGTYLADYLEGAAAEFEAAIRVDLCASLASNIREARRELDETAKELAKLKAEVKEAERKLAATKVECDREVRYAAQQVVELVKSVQGIDDNMSALRRIARELKDKK